MHVYGRRFKTIYSLISLYKNMLRRQVTGPQLVLRSHNATHSAYYYCMFTAHKVHIWQICAALYNVSYVYDFNS